MKSKIALLSPTGRINSLAEQKKAMGIKVVNLSAGELKISLHPIIAKGVESALKQNYIFYPPMDGIPALKTAAVKWMNQQYGCQYIHEECLITNGGKFGIYLLLQHLLKKSDEVIFASPYWVSYPSITQLFGGNSKIIKTRESQDWKIQLSDLKKNVSSKTKILILNNAANPTGILYTKKELQGIMAFAHSKKLFVISDEVYSELTYIEKNKKNVFVSLGSSAFKKYHKNLAVIQSCSKNFGMTGFRVGFLFADKKIISTLIAMMSQTTSGVTTLSQWAAVSALESSNKIHRYVKDKMNHRKNVLIKSFKKYFGLQLKAPQAGLYLFVKLLSLGVKDSNISSALFCEDVLNRANVAIVPGEAFGQEGYVRFSFGAAPEELESGVRLLSEFIEKFDALG